MVLVLTPESTLFMHWQGLYEVIEAAVEVNYKVKQPNQREPEQIYDIII